MRTHPIITWRNMDHSPAVDSIVNERIEALDKFHPNIIGCTVVIDAPQKRRVTGRGFDVRVQLEIPGPNLNVARHVRHGHAADDVIRAVNAAFTALEGRLKAKREVIGGVHVKHHPPELHGEIVELEDELGWGHLRADDGREVYFQRDSLVSGDWETLEIGDRLRFRERDGEKGAFATDVAVMART
ncbi:HPF/RaiA family ribosome-associated protein [Acidimangrovimonas pyrenivorans]|uniref:HPF/RaiA family ribosome-associated protein n=1 Tax=Acidimangrovimonas pyrenivorans TaxID=2030798 RepID=A0ABV7AJY6_9RHOB